MANICCVRRIQNNLKEMCNRQQHEQVSSTNFTYPLNKETELLTELIKGRMCQESARER